MKKNFFGINDNKIDENINFKLVGGIEKNVKKVHKNLDFEVIDEDKGKNSHENVEFEIINEENYKNIDVSDAFGQKNNKTNSDNITNKANNNTYKKDYDAFNIIITFILEMIFGLIAFSIPILGFILSIIYFIRGENFSALIYIILSIAGYITAANIFLDIINFVF